jgi:hypothetical protein
VEKPEEKKMKHSRRKRTVESVVPLLIVGALSLQACVPQTEVPEVTQEPPRLVTEEIEPGEEALEEELQEVESQPFFIPGQVIVVGNVDQINATLSTIPDIEGRLGLVSDFDLGYLDGYESPSPEAVELPFESARIGDRISPLLSQTSLALRLYEIDGRAATVTETMNVLNEINAAGNSRGVHADPNYHVSPHPVSPCGDPFIIGGSPFIIGGSPFIIGGSPFIIGGSSMGVGAGGAGEADAGIFWGQWAFRIVQDEFPDRGAQIAVFDTSPFPISQDDPISESDVRLAVAEGTWSIEWPTSEPGRMEVWPGDQWTFQRDDFGFNLNVLHPPMSIALTPRSVDTVDVDSFTPADVRDHGLFIAGLAYGVSKEPEIYLVRVLNDHGCGDLFTLTTAIHAFMKHMLIEFGTLEDVVLNLSLGVPQPPPDFFATLRDENVDEAFVSALEQELASLEETLSTAFAQGAVIVAASGNESGVNDPRPANIPADYPYVVGVAAENINNERACYSNLGDVSAPGAEGRTPGMTPADACEPLFQQCDPTNGACGLGLVSLSTFSPTGFRFWVGSSFAAPLMSGWAADNLAAGVGQSATISNMRSGFQP